MTERVAGVPGSMGLWISVIDVISIVIPTIIQMIIPTHNTISRDTSSMWC